jgi:predicted ribosomally synthesized peptide with SipW-like signal peptide
MTSSKSVIPGELADQEQERKRKKRGAIVKFSLAGVALLGIGAAATSAAWTDDAWFSGAAHSVDKATAVKLQGSLDNSTWKDSNSKSGVELTIDAATLGTLVPGDDILVPLYLKNAGTEDLAVSGVVEAATGVLFEGAAGDTTTPKQIATAEVVQGTDGDDLANPLAAGDTAKVYLEVTVPDWDNDQAANYSDQDGTVYVQFQGSTIADN